MLGGGAYLAANAGKDNDEMSVLEVSTDAVTTTDSFEQAEWGERMSLAHEIELDYGTMLWCNDPSVAVCLLPTDKARPLVKIGILTLGNGTCSTVLEQAVGSDEGFEVYDVRGNSNGLAWVEENILDNVWRVYTATLSGSMTLGEPTLAAEGGSDWEIPSLAAVGNRAFWQVLPKVNGAMSTSDSTLTSAPFGSTDTTVVYTSHGRMATPPYALQDSLVITPRANVTSIYYQLTHIDGESGQVLDTMTLPGSMKPLEAGYGQTGFTFTFDAIYNYGDGIANLGTYVPTVSVEPQPAEVGNEDEDKGGKSSGNNGGSGGKDADDTSEPTVRNNDSYSDVPWFCFNRTPTAAPAWCGGYFMVKSTSAVVGVDLDANCYFSSDVANGADDYGEYLASTGMQQSVVTYTNIDYTPISGDAQKLCRVRIWKPLENS